MRTFLPTIAIVAIGLSGATSAHAGACSSGLSNEDLLDCLNEKLGQMATVAAAHDDAIDDLSDSIGAPWPGLAYQQEEPSDFEGINVATWTFTGQDIDLPAAGTYLVVYNAETFRTNGDRGDQDFVRLSTDAAVYETRGVTGTFDDKSQAHGTVTIATIITVPDSDTVEVEALGRDEASLQLRNAELLYVRLD